MTLIASLVGYAAALSFLLTTLLLAGAQRAVGGRFLDPAIRLLCRLCLGAFGVRVRVTGAAAVPRNEGCLVVANHVCILDPLVLFAALPVPARGVELEDHFSWPIWGGVTRMMGTIPISHRDTAAAVRSLHRAAQVLRGATSVVILPEGHRTRDGLMGPFMRGPFRLAQSTGVPLVPVAMRDLYARKSVHSPRVRPGTVTVAFGSPITATGYRDLSERELAALARAEVERLLHS